MRTMQAEAIYKGATRPAMKLGIPLVPLVVLFGGGMLLIMWGGTLVSWWIALAVVIAFVPALLWMRFVTSKDDQRFRQMFVALKLRWHDHNRRFWQARSYSPSLYRGSRDAWHV
jgi:type IV secretion system protein VirB3